MAVHKTRRGLGGWLLLAFLTVAFTIEGAAAFIFLVVLVDIVRMR